MATFSFTIIPDTTGPVITPISPTSGQAGVPATSHVKIGLTDDNQVDLATLVVVVDSITYITGGAPANGGTFTAPANAGNGFDVDLVKPGLFVHGAHTVTVTVHDTDGNSSTLTYSFTTTVLPRLLQVTNPQEKFLIAHFNASMAHDAAFLAPANWQVTPVTAGASELTIVEVRASAGHPDQAVLIYVGGDSSAIYNLLVVGVSSVGGDPIDPAFDNVDFELVYAIEAPLSIKLFNSVFGPIGISQRPLLRRTIDRMVVNRSIALGVDAQLQLRFQSVDNGTAGRDGRPGIVRT